MQRFRGKRIAVLMGGMSAEREISLRSGRAVYDALLKKGYKAVRLDAGKDLAQRLWREKPGAAFIALHGRLGEDGCVQGMLEVMGIPYTGSGVLASSIAMDKAAAKKIFACDRVPTPGFELLSSAEGTARLKPPFVVKPSTQGSAIGVSIVRRKKDFPAAITQALSLSKAALIEEFIDGRELTVAVLNNRPLPIIEIRPKDAFYSYSAKYTKGRAELIVPANIGKRAEKKVAEVALSAYNAIGCRGGARVDVMLDSRSRPYVLEVNTIPGMTELSLFPKAASAAGMDYPALVEEMLSDAAIGKG
ncbi:MAG: D-alanine--D-alanine ligase [Deltaproteobacteria bacterium]|nr:D-alanine--D-alanine ligase [Deltaproteobacteria bacterium]